MSTDYKKKITELEDEYKNKYSSFDYDAEKDELFKLQREQLERGQQSGVSDVLARYAANTGMAGSSEAMSAAQQTASKYNSMIADALSAAEQKQYERWSAEKNDLASRIVNTKNEAFSDAQTKMAFGDLSGYEALGYDTTEYKKQQAAAAESAAAEAEREALELALKIAKETGDTSALAQFGINATGYSDQVGKNGMTKNEYTSIKDRLLRMYDAYDSKYRGELSYGDYIKAIDAKLEELDKDYYNGFEAVDTDIAMQILSNLDNSGESDVDTGTYYALLEYFTQNPVVDSKGNKLSGESALKYYGITNNNKKSYSPIFR